MPAATSATSNGRSALPATIDCTKRGLEMFLGPLEAAVMRAVWAGAISTRGVYNAVRRVYVTEKSADLAFTSVTTTVTRLFERGLLQRKTTARVAYSYTPVYASEAEFVADCLRLVVGALVEAYPREAGAAIVTVVKKGRQQ